MKISDRDKLIVKWFGLFLMVTSLWYFGIRPFGQYVASLDTERLTLQSQKEMADLDILMESQIQIDETVALKSIQENFERYTMMHGASEVEAYLRPLLDTYPTRIVYFGVSPAQVISPVTTLKVRSDLSYRLKILVDEYQQMTITPPTLPSTQSQVVMIQVNYQVEMSFEDYQMLLNDIDALDRAHYLSNSSYVFKDAIAELNFNVYMTQALDFNQ